MSIERIKKFVLEDFDDDAYGSWEIFWGVRSKFSELSPEELRHYFLTAIGQLIEENKLFVAIHPESGKYEPVEFDSERLAQELAEADRPNGYEFYWFLTEPFQQSRLMNP